MKRIVSALDAGQTLALEHDLLRRSDLHVHTVTTIEELLIAVRESAQLVLVGPLLPDGDARDALEAIRAERDLADLPVVLVATQEIADRVGTEGFAAVLSGTLTDPVDERLSVLLESAPRQSRRRRGFARVRDKDGQPLGHAIDFSDNGVLLRTRTKATVGQELALSLELPGTTTPVSGHARVVRVSGERIALSFQEASTTLRTALAAATGDQPTGPRAGLAFAPRESLGSRGVELAGAFIEGPALAALVSYVASASTDPVRISARDLTVFDEGMLDRFLALLDEVGTTVELSSCPAWLTDLCARMPSVSRRARIASFWVALHCPSCDDRFEDLASLANGTREAARTALSSLTQGPCLVCGGQLALVEDEEALLAFSTP